MQTPTRTVRLDADSRDFGKIGNIGAIDKMGWAKIPTYYYDVSQIQMPMTTADFQTKYSGTVPLFNEISAQSGRQTNAETGSGVNEPFLAFGVGVVAIAEGFSFTVPGALVDIDRANGEACIPQVDGCEGDEGGTARNATLYWGGPGWNFINNFFQRYRLQMLVNRRFQLVDESLFDVGMVPVPPEFVGASDSLIPAMPYIRATNDVLKSKSISKAFLAQNIAGTVCTGAPTAGVTYGHTRIHGLANRLYCFNQPIPILPGMRFDVNFTPIENDISFLAAMQREAVLDPSTPTSPDADYSTDTICNTGITGSAFNVPGGTLSLGLVFKGTALQPRACVEYVTDYMVAGSAMASMVYGLSGGYLGSLLNIPGMREMAGDNRIGKLAGLLKDTARGG